MSLVPYKVTAIKKTDPTGNNVLPDASVSIIKAGGGFAQLWDDEDGTIPRSNPFQVDSNGERQIWLNGGEYSVSVAGGQSWDIKLSGGSDILFIENVAALSSESPIVGQVYILKEFNSGSGTGGGELTAKSGAITPNNVTTFASATAGVYFERINLNGIIHVEMAGVLGAILSGNADESTKIQAAIDAAEDNDCDCQFGAYVYFCKNISLRSGVKCFGSKGKTSLRRPSSDSEISFVVKAEDISGFSVYDVTVDGNKDTNTNAGIVFYIDGCWDFNISNTKVENGKAAGGYGTGLSINNLLDSDYNTISVLYKVEAVNNEGPGISPYKATGLWIDCGYCHGNSLAGLSIVDFANPPPASPTIAYVHVTGGAYSFNGGAGIEIGGYIIGYNGSGQQINGASNPTASRIHIDGPTIRSNAKYGLVVQSSRVLVSNTTITNNGDDLTNGGVLFNATSSSLVNCTIANNYFYGVDAGGAIDCSFVGGFIQDNGQVGSSCSGLNLSCSQDCLVDSVKFRALSTSNGGYCIAVNAYDGGVDPVFPTLMRRTTIKNCNFYLGNNDNFGIVGDTGDGKVITINNNEFHGGQRMRALTCSMVGFSRKNNNHWVGEDLGFLVASATSIVIPDQEEDITISGTASINNIYSFSQNENLNKVRACAVTAFGSGYTPGTSTPVSFTGGDGTGAAGYALVSNSGLVRAIVITNKGTGYTVAPTVTIGGTGSGATAVALLQASNIEKNRIVIKFASTATLVNNTGNLRLTGGNIVGTDRLYVTLEGRNNLWYEVSRSG